MHERENAMQMMICVFYRSTTYHDEVWVKGAGWLNYLAAGLIRFTLGLAHHVASTHGREPGVMKTACMRRVNDDFFFFVFWLTGG